MQGITPMLLMGVLLLILLRGAMTGVNAHAAFLRGAERGMQSALSLLPALCAMLLMLNLVQSSGLAEVITRLLSPLTRRMGLPEEVTPLTLLRPLTGSGSLAALERIFRLCGPDSRAGRIASVLMASSETIFYTMAVYAGAAGVKKLPGALAASLIGYGASVVVCCLLVR